MVDHWYSCIDRELSLCEQTMMDALQFENPELTEMCRYVISSGGKRLRPSLCIIAYKMCGGADIQTPINIGAAFEIVHSATLIHDDINDQGEIRRGRKTLHREYTTTKAIVAGDCMFAVGYNLLVDVKSEIVRYVLEASSAMASGEFVQKDYEHVSRVTEDDYMRIISGKTAKLFEASAKSGAYTANPDSEYISNVGDFAYELGLAFQIIDDTLDVTGDPNNTGKAIGTDLLEGKPTLPLIYAMEDPRYKEELTLLFEEVDVTSDMVVRALELIRDTDAVERCLQKARQKIEVAKSKLAPLPDSVYKQSLLSLADFVVSRDR